MPYYVSFGINILHWIEKQSALLQGLLFVPALALFGGLYVLEEVLFEKSWIGMMVAAVTGLVCYYRKGSVVIKSKLL